ncbi:FAD-dependent oxidoreductase [Brevundimonas naejangsanensis]|uniref:FAD-dependent oxidoreductase n=1 Tax=Brevundimonas naejangsanensis TaxID=588932 RepID=UPI000414E6A8|nr:FAD-dependent monooxygenase [Brevundimonas naejangsanensis]
MQQWDAQVVIVGAGPVGLSAALRLEAFGISAIVLEAETELPEDLRASTFHPPTLDMLAQYGLAEPLIAQGLKCEQWQIRHHETGERAVFDLSYLQGETQHPFRLQCEQFRLCRILADHLSDARHVEIRMGATVCAVDQDGDGVNVTYEQGGQAQTLRCRYLIGADGARSAVRTLLGWELDGKTYPETTILAITDFPFEDHLEGLSNVNYCWTDGGTFSLLKLKDFWRCSLYPRGEESIEDALDSASIERKLQAIVARDEPYKVLEIRPYRVHMRIAPDYRSGRVVLAGDAAHINSPSGGMGMNGGVHDAFNLTEKLKAVLEGADERLLDLYTRQRRPIAEQEILAQADRNRGRMQERDPERRKVMMAEMQAMLADPVRHKDYVMRSSMIDGLRKAATLA